jgi:hypothetical protein
MAAQITTLPTPPSRQDPTNFNDRADSFLGALPTFQSQANALSTEVNNRADTVEASSTAVLAATNITKWASGTTYAEGAVVWSPVNGLGYRRITASGSGTTDPSSDTTNYKQVNGTGDVSTSGNQTIAGTKTFSSTIVGSISGNAATATSAGTATSATTATSASTAAYADFALVAGLLSASNLGSAPHYAVRAWVNFNGTGTPSVRSSGNVSSITDNAVGNFTINFSTSMYDGLYCIAGVASANSSGAQGTSVVSEAMTGSSGYSNKSTSQCQILITDNNTDSLTDPFSANILVMR